jgi:ferredoxin-fold anticodon binding domain-containing protein
MNITLMRSLVGRKVSVFTVSGQSGYKDEGIVRSVDDQVIVIEKGQDVLYFVIQNIRLIKVLE